MMRWGAAWMVSLLVMGGGLSWAQEWNTLQSTATPGNGAELDVNGYHSVSLVINMASTGTVQIKIKGDGNYGDLACTDLSDPAGALVTSVTASKNLVCSTGGLSKVQTPITAAGGTITVKARVSNVIIPGGGGGGGGGGTSVTEDAPHVSGEAIVPLGCRRNDVAASSAATDGDWATVNCDSSGRVRSTIDTAVAPTSFTPSDGCTLASEKINISSATTTTVVASIASNYIKVYGLFFRVGSSGANNVTVRDSTPTTLIDLLDFSAKESLFLPMQPTPWFSSAASTGLQIVTSTTAPVVGRVYYTQCTVAP